jgi:hypothetical protein
MRANMQCITDSSSTKRVFCRTKSDAFSRGFEGVSVSEEMAESGRHPARRLCRSQGLRLYPGPPGDPTLQPRAGGYGENLAKSRR